MNPDRYNLSQILDLVDRKTLARLVERYDAGSRVQTQRREDPNLDRRGGLPDGGHLPQATCTARHLATSERSPV